MLFDGVKNQRISLRMSSVTIGWSYISIIKPDGTALVSPYTVSSSGGFIDTRTLPLTGTYTILIDPDTTYTGNMTLTLYDVPADVSSAITQADRRYPSPLRRPGRTRTSPSAGRWATGSVCR